jgi:adenosyl cobinamide kinase/adenosyl cobinamide phosphate guanylyltransferase
MSTLILGGARSGKSRMAVKLALTKARETGLPLLYLATAHPDAP